MDLAVKAGARRLVLFGLDASYPPAEVERIVEAARRRLKENRSTLQLDAAQAGQTLEA
jgi:hypothetical protein